VEKSTNNEQKCGNCWYAVKRSPSNLVYWGFAYKYLECTATDKTLNIYKDKDDRCDIVRADTDDRHGIHTVYHHIDYCRRA